jgi:hypothetical protein
MTITTEQIQPISELARGHKRLLALLKEGPVFLTQHGRPAAVMLSPMAWDDITAQVEQLQSVIDVLEAKLDLAEGGGELEDFEPTGIQS